MYKRNKMASKYVDRILEEVTFNFERHFHDKDDRIDFLEELIEELKDLLEGLNYENGDDDEWQLKHESNGYV